jgi:sugar phosphate isomerase/epimerase
VSRDRPLSLAHLTLMAVPPVDLARAAAAAGFDAVGIRVVPTSSGIDHGVLGKPARLAEVRAAVDDLGLTVLDAEVVRVQEPARSVEPQPVLAAAAQLGASWVITTVEDAVPERRVESFARLCELAAEHGVGIALEYMIFSAVADLAAAVALVDASGAPNACVLSDALHHVRAGGTAAEIAAVDPRLLPYAQLCDATPNGAQPNRAVARAEATGGRLLPGSGALPLVDFISALPRGCALSVETPLSGVDTRADAMSVARRAFATTKTLLAESVAAPAAQL